MREQAALSLSNVQPKASPLSSSRILHPWTRQSSSAGSPYWLQSAWAYVNSYSKAA